MAQENRLELNAAEDPAIVHRMLTWMYVSNYDDEPAVSHGMQSHLARALVNIDVYCIAENYDLASLQEKAIEKILSQSWSMWTTDEINILFKKIGSEIPSSIGKNLISDCTDQVPGLFFKEDGTCAIRDVEKFTSDCFQELQIQKRDQKIARLEQQVLASKWDAIISQMQPNEVQTERDKLQAQRDIAVDQLDRAIRATVEEDDCEECGAEFGAYLRSPPLSNLPLVLSCKRCHKTRYPCVVRMMGA